jgi:hypothetical protein
MRLSSFSCPFCLGGTKCDACAKTTQEYSRFQRWFRTVWVLGGGVQVMIRTTDKMNRLIYFCFITSLALLLYLAPIAKAQGTYTAASCNYSDVNAVINGPTHTAANGDTINIPAGRCTWTSSLSITRSISIIGSGTPNGTPNTFGAGTLNTIITDNVTSGAPLFGAKVTYNSGALLRLSTLDIEPTATHLSSPVQIAGTCSPSNCPNIRVDNIGFGLTTRWNEGVNGSGSDWMILVDNAFGVLDHNTLPSGSQVELYNANLGSYLGVGDYGDNSWAQPDTMGMASQLYAENNIVYSNQAMNDCDVAPQGYTGGIYGVGGCRIVDRFNQFTFENAFGLSIVHGLDTDGRPQSGRTQEAYGNRIMCNNAVNCGTLTVGFRGGTGIVFGNTATVGANASNNIISITVYRNVYTATSGWGACGGSSPYDTNDGTVYYSGTTTSGSSGSTMYDTSKNFGNLTPAGAPYSVYDVTRGFWAEVASNTATSITIQGSIPEQNNSFNVGDSYQILRATVCADQAGRGQGNYISGLINSVLQLTGSPGPLNQALDPIYEWNDSVNKPTNYGNVGTDTGRTIANRDWYTDNSSGSPKAQTSPTSPFNGSGSGGIGVGFGTLANRPTTCTTGVGYFATDQGSWNTSGNSFGEGELFTCTATNAWSSSPHYTPYTYPHPLTDGTAGSGGGPPPNPPTALSATVQ